MKSRGAIFVLAIALAPLAGCGGSPEVTTAEDIVDEGSAWWNNPGAIRDHLAAVGASVLLNAYAEPAARTEAENDGRAKLAASLRARITQLVENWSKNVGDLNKERSFSSLVNNEALTRQFVDTVVAGAAPHRYHKTKTNVFVLMVLHDPAQWTNNVLDELEEQALQDETLLKTEVLKNEFRKKMDALREEEKQKVQEQAQRFQSSLGASPS